MRYRGAGFDALADDLDASVAELITAVGRDPALWERGRPGRWTIGQHAAHVGITLERTADDFETAERALRAGTLAPVPAKRALLHRLFLGLVAGRGYLPRMPRWHYRLPEMVRVHAVHARHHAKQIVENVAGA